MEGQSSNRVLISNFAGKIFCTGHLLFFFFLKENHVDSSVKLTLSYLKSEYVIGVATNFLD